MSSGHEWEKLNYDEYWRCHKCDTSIQVRGTPSPDLKRSILVSDNEGAYSKSDLLSCDEIIAHRICTS